MFIVCLCAAVSSFVRINANVGLGSVVLAWEPPPLPPPPTPRKKKYTQTQPRISKMILGRRTTVSQLGRCSSGQLHTCPTPPKKSTNSKNHKNTTRKKNQSSALLDDVESAGLLKCVALLQFHNFIAPKKMY